MKGYLAVDCADNTEHVIPLKVVDSPVGPFLITPFSAPCPICKETRRYDGSRVRGILGPPPDENFQTHPSEIYDLIFVEHLWFTFS
jgi:hypothetical protein